jgi:hypothetical protein
MPPGYFKQKKKLIDIGFRVGLSKGFGNSLFWTVSSAFGERVQGHWMFFEGLILGQSTYFKSISPTGCAQEQYCPVLNTWFLRPAS